MNKFVKYLLRDFSKIKHDILKENSNNCLIENQNGFRKNRSYVDPSYRVELIEKKRRFDVESQLSFRDYEDIFDRSKGNLFNILQKYTK